MRRSSCSTMPAGVVGGHPARRGGLRADRPVFPDVGGGKRGEREGAAVAPDLIVADENAGGGELGAGGADLELADVEAAAVFAQAAGQHEIGDLERRVVGAGDGEG